MCAPRGLQLGPHTHDCFRSSTNQRRSHTPDVASSVFGHVSVVPATAYPITSTYVLLLYPEPHPNPNPNSTGSHQFVAVRRLGLRHGASDRRYATFVWLRLGRGCVGAELQLKLMETDGTGVSQFITPRVHRIFLDMEASIGFFALFVFQII